MPSKRSFPPVTDSRTRILILGSLPGDASLAQQQYYAHPQNKFWRLLGESIGVELTSLEYQRRLSVLLEHHIGLWDVIANAHRVGSLDSDIRKHTRNDLVTLIASLPELKTIAFNGATAAKIGMHALGQGAERYRILQLPSSSPAHASVSYDKKLDVWRQLTA